MFYFAAVVPDGRELADAHGAGIATLTPIGNKRLALPEGGQQSNPVALGQSNAKHVPIFCNMTAPLIIVHVLLAVVPAMPPSPPPPPPQYGYSPFELDLHHVF